MTALLDAVGRAINETGERLAKMDEQDRPGLVVFVVMTDGHENSNKEAAKALACHVGDPPAMMPHRLPPDIVSMPSSRPASLACGGRMGKLYDGCPLSGHYQGGTGS